MPGPYRKRFIPLESNFEVFSRLLHKLGVSSELHFEEIYTLDEPDQLPKDVLALVLIEPAPEGYEERKAEEDTESSDHEGGEVVMWFRQTIHNACGFYALLHSVFNGRAKEYIRPGSLLANILETCQPLGTHARAQVLESSTELETIYADAANEGDTAVPAIDDEVESHYIYFVRSTIDSHLYELDGDRKGPIDKGFMEAGGLLAGRSLELVKGRMQDGGIGYGLMVLVCER